jgi:hypothetical protein
MKKNNKNLILIFLGLVIIILLVYVVFSSKDKWLNKAPQTNTEQSNNISTSTPSSTPAVEVIDPAVMTKEERRAFRIGSSTKVEVIRRSATGTPTDYRILK